MTTELSPDVHTEPLHHHALHRHALNPVRLSELDPAARQAERVLRRAELLRFRSTRPRSRWPVSALYLFDRALPVGFQAAQEARKPRAVTVEGSGMARPGVPPWRVGDALTPGIEKGGSSPPSLTPAGVRT